MKIRTLVMVLPCVAIAATAAWASTVEKPRLAQQVKDPATGLDVRVFVGGAADVSIEVGDSAVQIQKQLVRGAAVTRLVTANEQLTLTVDGRIVRVDGTLGHVEARPDRPGSHDALRRVLKRSVAVQRATTLLGRLNFSTRVPVGHTLLATRAMLLAETGDAKGIAEMARWVQTSRQTLALKPVALQSSDGPGECWKKYAEEALALYADMEECVKNVAWYDIPGEMGCALVYDVRAIGAFSWYMKCVALKS